MGRNNKIDPISIGAMHNQLKISSGNVESSFYRRMMESLLYRIAINRVQWLGLPDRIDPLLMEQMIVNNETLALHIPRDDDNIPLTSTPILCTAVGAGKMNYQRLPSYWNLRSLSGMTYTTRVPFEEIALLDPRMLRNQVRQIITYYTELFDEFDRALKSNLRIQKTPVVILTSENQKLTMQNLINQYSNGEPIIMGYEGLNVGDIQALTFKVDYVADRILIDRRQAWNDCMTYLGIDNTNQDKRERLVSDEVSGNDGQIQMSRHIDLSVREEFAEKSNQLFDTDISVSWNGISPSFNYGVDEFAGELLVPHNE